MTESIHPLPEGAKVHHSSQLWARTVDGGTAVVREVLGPYHDGAYEYVVDACRDFSRRPGPDNPMDRRTQWPSYYTVPAREVPSIEEVPSIDELLSRALLIKDRSMPVDIVDRDRPGYGDVPGA